MAEAVRWGKRGARVNTISPGIIFTPLAKDELTGPRGAGLPAHDRALPGRARRHAGRGRNRRRAPDGAGRRDSSPAATSSWTAESRPPTGTASSLRSRRDRVTVDLALRRGNTFPALPWPDRPLDLGGGSRALSKWPGKPRLLIPRRPYGQAPKGNPGGGCIGRPWLGRGNLKRSDQGDRQLAAMHPVKDAPRQTVDERRHPCGVFAGESRPHRPCSALAKMIQ